MSSLSFALVGMNHAEDQLDATAKRVAQQGPSPESSISLIEAKNSSAASARVAQIASGMWKTAIDMYA